MQGYATYKFCLVDGPKANFSILPGTNVCRNSPVTFINNSVGGTIYFWDFGDGSFSSLQNPPPHSYSSSGTKTIKLTVSRQCSGNKQGSPIEQPESTYVSPCTSVYYQTIIVSNKDGLSILANCNKMICAGEKVKYCAGGNCSSLQWQVNGGTIMGNATGNCVEVFWNNPPSSGLPSITLNGNCSSSCGNTVTLEVPVLYNNLPVSGNPIVCKGSQETYSLPVMPGVFYTWTVTPAMQITGNSLNTNSIDVDWSSATIGNSYIIHCDYFNPDSGPNNSVCSGSTNLVVKVRPRLSITGPSPICTGINATYSLAPNLTSPTALWSMTPSTGFSPAISTTPSASISANWSIGGAYQLQAALTAASQPDFCTTDANLFIQVNPTPTISINPSSPVCPNTPIMYSATVSVPGGTFFWNVPGGTIITDYEIPSW